MREKRKFTEFLNSNINSAIIVARILQTKGSTYRKKGALKIISMDGDSCGLISGGCLERAIVEKALNIKGTTEIVVFDTIEDEDRLYGYSTGCKGQLTIEFQKWSPGQWSIEQIIPNSQWPELDVLVFGAGVDIDPLYELLIWSGWNIRFFTQQRDLLKVRRAQNWPIELIDFTDFQLSIKNPTRTAVLIMSHNYPTDLELLANINHLSISYVGVLGPSQRREQLLLDLEKVHQVMWPADQLQNLISPMGVDNLGRGQQAIALSIVAQLQQRFFNLTF